MVREEHYCVPAYCFSCSATAHYNYEKGANRTETIAGDTDWLTGKPKERVHIDWHPASGAVSDNYTVFVPGNNDLAKQFIGLYSDLSSSKLIDFDERYNDT